jgi:hypothetical protein
MHTHTVRGQAGNVIFILSDKRTTKEEMFGFFRMNHYLSDK